MTKTHAGVALSALLLTACVHRGVLPTDASVLLSLRSSECPRYELALHDDGTIDYWGQRPATRIGVWSKQVPPDVVTQARATANAAALKRMPESAAVAAQITCRGYGAHMLFLSLRAGTGVDVACIAPDAPSAVEDELLGVLGVRDWVRLSEPCPMSE